MAERLLVPGAEPYLYPGGATGCLLLHGFTSMPAELAPLARFLARQGYSVLGARLAGHATHPRDLRRVKWEDWLLTVEDSLALLDSFCEQVVLVGQSLGGMLALVAAARYAPAAVVAMSTPFFSVPPAQRLQWRWQGRLGMIQQKEVRPAAGVLAERREAAYPAYPAYPLGVLAEIAELQEALLAALPAVEAPTLLLQSRADEMMAPGSMEEIYARLGSSRKRRVWLKGMGHALVRDSQRELVFWLVDRFLRRL